MADRNALPGRSRIEFRIGINLGDVISDADDIFGDGVNIAARLEALPSRRDLRQPRVRDQWGISIDFAFEEGEQQVKNIARPVRRLPHPDCRECAAGSAARVADKPSIACAVH